MSDVRGSLAVTGGSPQDQRLLHVVDVRAGVGLEVTDPFRLSPFREVDGDRSGTWTFVLATRLKVVDAVGGGCRAVPLRDPRLGVGALDDRGHPVEQLARAG